MCGIVGLFIKDKSLENKLGSLLSEMLITMTDRGPDSAGVAIYDGGSEAGKIKLTIQSPDFEADFALLAKQLGKKTDTEINLQCKDSHAVLMVEAEKQDEILQAITALTPNVRVMSMGKNIEIYKEVGLPEDIVKRFALDKMKGSHGIGHTRMATESVVTTMGAHPFSTGLDQCLVHNGSMSNHNNLRRILRLQGMGFETDNDSEVAAAYISHQLKDGMNLKTALEKSLIDLDGFFTFMVGTGSGFGVLRDRVACKPAVLAENDKYVAMASEYRSLANLPDIKQAKIWEPEPEIVYFWEH